MIKGIVRKIDDLGRITLPREYRRTLGIVAGWRYCSYEVVGQEFA